MKKSLIFCVVFVLLGMSAQAQIKELKITHYGIAVDSSGIVLIPGTSLSKVNKILRESGWQYINFGGISRWEKGNFMMFVHMDKDKLSPLFAGRGRFVYSVWVDVSNDKFEDIKNAIIEAESKGLEVSRDTLFNPNRSSSIGFHVLKKVWL